MLQEYDIDILIFFNQLGFEAFDSFWIVVTNILTWIPLFLFMIWLLFKTFPKPQAVTTLLFGVGLVLFTLLFTELVKEIVQRVRPSNDVEVNHLIRVLKRPSNYSFFSGHASNSFALTTFLFLVLRKHYKGIALLFIWPLLFIFSRLYVGVHYPSDILVGTAVGILFAFVFYKFYRRRIPATK